MYLEESFNGIYKNVKLSDKEYIRVFSSDIESNLLVWHTDLEDRIIVNMNDSDWLFQLDNKLPCKIDKEIFIPRNTYHRIIKGSGDLVIKITKLN